MPKKSQNNSQANVKPQASLGSRIFEALTETEISQLLDELFAVLADEQRSTVFAKLQPDTKATLTYSTNAAWMSALKELAPQSYQRLLSEWKVQHQRRRNLWKAMGSLGQPFQLYP
jgi:hypothetical protein